MKKILWWICVLFFSGVAYGQSYTPMPTDSCYWRYRIYDIDYITHVLDNILFLNGADTVANGKTYHKIMSRLFMQVVPNGTEPPIVPVEANLSDTYYGAMREESRQVFLLSGTGEDLLYDFNARVGDSIPAYLSRVRVVAIDSVLLGGSYHRRYRSTDTGYYVIEGVGSSRGLIPDLNDGGADIFFYCFSNTAFTFTPDSTFPCTYIYPIGYSTAVTNVNDEGQVDVYPIPATDVLHIGCSVSAQAMKAFIFNSIGQCMYTGTVSGAACVPIEGWPRGIYYVRVVSRTGASAVKKIIVN